MTFLSGPGPRSYKTFADAYDQHLVNSRKFMDSKSWAKMFMNSAYGKPKAYNTLLRRCFARRDDAEKASLWVRLFGERPKKTDPDPYPYLRTSYQRAKPARITKTGQKELRRLMKKMGVRNQETVTFL